MIESIKIENFRCIRSAEIKLAPLTVFVGPNGSGKSSILDALDSRHSRGNLTTWQKGPGRSSFTASIDGARHNWEGSNSGPHGSQILHLDPRTLRQPNIVAPADQLAPDGSNLTNVFATLTRRAQENLAKAICSLVPVFGDVDVRPVGGGNHQLRFQDRWAPDVWYAPEEVSDGTMLMTAFLTLQHQTARVHLVGIEDAEHGLHPYLLAQLVKLLRALANGQHGPAIQVVATTHSAELLDYLEPHEVRFVSRDPTDGSATVDAIDTEREDWRVAFDEYKHSLADVWLSGGAGGV